MALEGGLGHCICPQFVGRWSQAQQRLESAEKGTMQCFIIFIEVSMRGLTMQVKNNYFLLFRYPMCPFVCRNNLLDCTLDKQNKHQWSYSTWSRAMYIYLRPRGQRTEAGIRKLERRSRKRRGWKALAKKTILSIWDDRRFDSSLICEIGWSVGVLPATRLTSPDLAWPAYMIYV